MKKMSVLILMFGLIVAVFIGLDHKQKKDDIINEFIYDYYLSNNENKIFDVWHDGIPVPFYNYALPFKDDLSDIALNHKMIEAILPYYPMYVSVDEQETMITLSSKDKQKDITIPYVTSNDRFPKIDVVSYTNEKLFEEVLSVQKLASNSGVYITERFIDACDFDIQNKELNITVTLSIPLAGATHKRVSREVEPETEIIYDKEYESYEIEEYMEMEYTFPVAGIISKTNSEFSGYGFAQLWIPYEMAKSIYETTKSHFTGSLKDGSEYWEPSTYIIKLKEVVTVDDLGQSLLKDLADFSLEKADYIEGDTKTHIYSREED